MRVGGKKVRLLGRYGCAFAVGDAFAGFERRGLAFQRQLGGLFAGEGLSVHLPGVKQIQVSALVTWLHDVGFIGQGGERVFGGETGDVIGRLHGLRDRLVRKIRRARVAAPLAQVHRHAQGFVAVALHIFQLAFAHRHRQAAALGGFGTGIGGAELFGVFQGLVGQIFKKITAVAETLLRLGM